MYGRRCRCSIPCMPRRTAGSSLGSCDTTWPRPVRSRRSTSGNITRGWPIPPRRTHRSRPPLRSRDRRSHRPREDGPREGPHRGRYRPLGGGEAERHHHRSRVRTPSAGGHDPRECGGRARARRLRAEHARRRDRYRRRAARDRGRRRHHAPNGRAPGDRGIARRPPRHSGDHQARSRRRRVARVGAERSGPAPAGESGAVGCPSRDLRRDRGGAGRAARRVGTGRRGPGRATGRRLLSAAHRPRVRRGRGRDGRDRIHMERERSGRRVRSAAATRARGARSVDRGPRRSGRTRSAGTTDRAGSRGRGQERAGARARRGHRDRMAGHHAHRRRGRAPPHGPQADRVAHAPARLAGLVAEAGLIGLARDTLAVRLGVSPSRVTAVIAEAGEGVLALPDAVVGREAVVTEGKRLVELLRRYHAEHPLDPGMSLQALRAAIGPPAPPAAVTDAVLERALQRRDLEVTGSVAHLPRWRPALDARASDASHKLAPRLADARWQVPTIVELERELPGTPVRALLAHLARSGTIEAIDAERYAATGALAEFRSALEAALAELRSATPAELRDRFGLTRKYLIPLLEWADRRGITRRAGDARVLARLTAGKGGP